jgi:hypothetical protein
MLLDHLKALQSLGLEPVATQDGGRDRALDERAVAQPESPSLRELATKAIGLQGPEFLVMLTEMLGSAGNPLNTAGGGDVSEGEVVG